MVVEIDCFILSCSCAFSVSLPSGTVGWSAVYDCKIALQYSLTLTWSARVFFIIITEYV